MTEIPLPLTPPDDPAPIDPIPLPIPPDPSMTAYIHLLAAMCVEARNLFDKAGGLAKEYMVLGYNLTIKPTDFTGNMANLTPEHVAKVVEFVATLDQLVESKGVSGQGLTFRQAVLAMSRASR
jgi:hypothetical protein